MIKTEYYRTREDGVVLNRTYSDLNRYIERDGDLYSEAIDPAELNRTYTETDELIEEEPMEEVITETDPHIAQLLGLKIGNETQEV